MTKKYHVSIAARLPYNWETEVEAASEKEAIQKARDAFEEDATSGELVDVPGADIGLKEGDDWVYVKEKTS